MTATPIFSLSHFAIIPEHVAHAHVSERAKGLWRELALVAGPNRQEVWLRQASMAEKMGCSISTVQRALKELISAGLLFAKKRWHQGRHKVYSLAWQAVEAVKKILLDSTSVKNDRPRLSTVTDHVGQICPNLNIPPEYKKNKQQGGAQTPKNEDVVVFLIDKFGSEAVERQVEHLSLIKQKGTQINNEAAWLVAAVRGNYTLPQKSEGNEEKGGQSERTKKRDSMFNEAVKAYRAGQYQRAMALADKCKTMQYDLHLPSAKLWDACFAKMHDTFPSNSYAGHAALSPAY